MKAAVFNLRSEIQYDEITCGKCGIVFWVPQHFKNARVSDTESFWCPNGHQRHFTGESDKQKAARLETELASSQARAKELFQQQQALATANRKLRKRAKHGVCPCCSRTFKQLAAHMANKHPEFKP